MGPLRQHWSNVLAGAHLRVHAVPGCYTGPAKYNELGPCTVRLYGRILDAVLRYRGKKGVHIAEGESEEGSTR